MSLIDKPIPQGKHQVTRIFYKFNAPETELEFVRWTTSYLVVKYPTSGKPWRMGRKLVNEWLANGVLRIEGFIPELALVL